MKKLKIVFLLSILLIVNACKKEKIIKESYEPPQPTLYGTWKLVGTNQSLNDTTYLRFSQDGSNYVYALYADSSGFRSKYIHIYEASDKLLNLNSALYSYKIVVDTLTLINSPTDRQIYIRVNDARIDPSSWTGTISILKSVSAKGFGSLLSFGIDGAYLYVNGYGKYLYKYNTLTEQFEDSLLGVSGSVCYKSPHLYIGQYLQTSKIIKTNGFQLPATDVSLNDIYYPRNISVDPVTSVVYALTDDLKLYGGKEGTAFTQQFDFSKYEIDNAVYYKDGEFLVKQYPCLSRVKIASGLTVLRSYDPLPNYIIRAVSTNGADTWLFAQNKLNNEFTLLKVQFND